MTTLRIEKLDEVHLRVMSEFGVEAELTDYFTYEYPGAKFTPQYRARLWDGKVRLYDPLRKTLYVGLYDYIVRFAQSNGYDLELVNNVVEKQNVELDEVSKFVSGLNLHGRGQPIEIRDYQLDAIHTGLNDMRCVLLSPTGSGKSLIIYSLCRWLLQSNKKILIVVPTTSLVEQMYSDFEDYSTANEWSTDHYCQKLYSGFSKQFESDVLFTTWQSIYKQPKQWFDQFDVVIGDEAHQFKAKSLSIIMGKMTHVRYRIGTTGSLDNKKIHHLMLEGMFGKVYKVTTTKALQDSGRLAGLKVKSILLKYSNDIRKQCNKMEYQQEIDFIVTNAKRNNAISNLALACKGNTLVLFQYVEKHGAVLYDTLSHKNNNSRPIFFLHGNTDVLVREQVRKSLDYVSDAIIVASYGTSSTGINIPSIENIIFASPTKSVIRVLQSVGRGLRLNNGKVQCKLFDLTDDLHWKNWKNHTLKHGAERYKIYSAEQFDIQLAEALIE